MDGLLEGRAAVVTGAASGIGREIARTFAAQEVANVALFLASDLASYVTAESIVVDGGSTNTV